MTDVVIFNTEDGGEVSLAAGQLEMDSGLSGSAYLSMFGGNFDDSGLKAIDRKNWWGNASEPDQTRVYRSQTQYLLRSIPATPANLIRIEDAVNADLEWMTKELAETISPDVTMPARNQVKIAVAITIDGVKTNLTFVEPWGITT